MHEYSRAVHLQKKIPELTLLLPLPRCHQPKPTRQESPRDLSPAPSRSRITIATDAILETIKPRRSAERENLPVTNAAGGRGDKGGGGGGDHFIGLRRRMSSFSVRIQPLSSAGAGAFRGARSMPSVKSLAAAGELRRWWEWGVGWVMNRKPAFARDLEMNHDEAAALGCHCRGTWRHVLYKVRAEVRRLLGRDGLPLSAHDFRYDSVSYAQNFDNGDAAREP